MAGERHGHGMSAAWARHAMCESAFTVTLRPSQNSNGLYPAQGRASVVSPLRNIKRSTQCRYNVTLSRVRATIVAVVKL
jgi:hypothetical protein